MTSPPILRCAAALVSLVLLGASGAWGQSVDNKGTDFYFAFLPNAGAGADVELHLSADVVTDVRVRYPSEDPTFDQVFTVDPGAEDITIVSLPSAAGSWGFTTTTLSNLVRATAASEFVAYAIHRRDATSDAALGLPVDALNTEYIVMDRTVVGNAHYIVFAPFDDTLVTLAPPSGAPFQVALDGGQGHYVTGSALTARGTILTANRPVGLVNGANCSTAPSTEGGGACDHMFEIGQPTRTWGNEIPVAPLPLRTQGSFYQIYAAEDATQVMLDGAPLELDGNPVGPIDRGGRIEIRPNAGTATVPLAGGHVFSSEKPIYVVQYMTGQPSATQDGDPAQGNMIPSAQYQTGYTFSTVGGSQFARHFVSIIADGADLDTITLDGSPIGRANFTQIAGSSFFFHVTEISEGKHTTQSTHGHGITVEGYGFFDSYLYPGGAQFDIVNPTGDPDPPICEVLELVEDPFQLSGSARDDRTEDTNSNGVLDEGEDANDNGVLDVDSGIFAIELSEDAANATLTVEEFSPGDPQVGFTVDATEPGAVSGSVIARDGAGRECSIDLGEPPPPLPPGLFPTEEWGEAVDVYSGDGTFAFLAAQSLGVIVLDVGDPENIVELGRYAPGTCTDGDGTEYFYYADDVKFVPSQHVLHVASGLCGVDVVDVSDVFGGSYDRVGSYDTPNWAEHVEVKDGSTDAPTCSSGSILSYVADFDSVRIYDVGDPSAPVHCSALETADPGMGATPYLATHAFVDLDAGENYLAVASADGGSEVFVEDPAAPEVEGQYLHGSGSPNSVSQDVYVVDAEAVALLPIWAGGFDLVGFDEDTDGLVQLGHVDTDSAFFTARPCGDGICVTEGQNGLTQLGFDGEELGRIGSTDIGTTPGIDWAWDLFIDGCTAYVTFGNTGGGGGLQILPVPDCGVEPVTVLDGDEDGVLDDVDNCTQLANTSQIDSDGDGYGNRCDADLTNDGASGVPDFTLFLGAAGTEPGDPGHLPQADLTGDGFIGVPDFTVLLGLGVSGEAPGPSGLACAGTVPCP